MSARFARRIINASKKLNRSYSELLRHNGPPSLAFDSSGKAVNSKARKEARVMNISSKLVTGVIGGFLLVTAYVPAWARPVNQAMAPSTQSAAAANGDQAILGFLDYARACEASN
jgi:hypothetical protein